MRADQDLSGRLIVELKRLFVACDHCGHSRILNLRNFRRVAELGVHTFGDLCSKIRCGECPRLPVESRSLTIVPEWDVARGSLETRSYGRRTHGLRETQEAPVHPRPGLAGAVEGFCSTVRRTA